MKRNLVMLTFDLEEFDIPTEFGQEVSDLDQIQVTVQGMERLLPLLEKHQIRATFFTTGHFARQNPELIKKLSQKHESVSHALFHSPFRDFENNDILESKNVLESITGKVVNGFRMPRLAAFDKSLLSKGGFSYDSSINPTYIPGRYNLLHKSALPGIENGLIQIPCSTTPLLRFPLFWLSFKNLPVNLYSALCTRTMKRRGNLMLYFHPWEFADIDMYKLPDYVKSPDGIELVERLEILVASLRNKSAEFVTCAEFCKLLIPD